MYSLAQSPCYVGIDVSAQRLDVHLHPDKECFSLPHTRTGIWKLISRLGAIDAALIVLEPTGGLERPVADLLAETGFDVAVVNARQIRDYAKAIGRLAKTDTLDAEVIARFAEAIQPSQRHVADHQRAELAGLVSRRRQLVEMIKAESHRLKRAGDAFIRRRLKAHLTWLKREQVLVEKQLQDAIQDHPAWIMRAQLLESVPGVGKVVATTLIASLPELGRLHRARNVSISSEQILNPRVYDFV